MNKCPVCGKKAIGKKKYALSNIIIDGVSLDTWDFKNICLATDTTDYSKSLMGDIIVYHHKTGKT